MKFDLSDDQQQIKRTAHDLLAQRATPEAVRRAAESRTYDPALWTELRSLGWPGIAIAEEYGGQGLGLVELAVLCEELGAALAPSPFLAGVSAALVLESAGSPEQRERWLPGIASGEIRAALAVAHGGVAELVPDAPDADLILFVEGGEARVLLGGREATVETVETVDPTRSYGRVRPTEGAGEALAGDPEPGIDRATIAVSAEIVGVCARAMEMTLAYVKDRKQFGVAVGSFQAVAHRCAQMLLLTEGARSATFQAAWAAGADPERLAETASLAKSAASDAGKEVTASAIQAHGGIGFTWEADVHWYFKRAQADAMLLGGGRTHRARLARLVGERRAAAGAAAR
jgi:alkylation response protein AidB-like acyl-CoA dehydrogenase